MAINTFPTSVTAAVSAVVTGAGDVDLNSPTPCHGFDLRALVNHVTGTTGALARVGRREPLDPDDPYGAQQDHTTGDWQARLTSNLHELTRAWADPEAWQGTVDMGGHAMPATMIGEMALAEVALHGWDLAKASGQPLTVEPETAAELLRGVQETAELGRQMGAYGPAVAIASDADDFDRALAASGRDPDWVVGG